MSHVEKYLRSKGICFTATEISGVGCEKYEINFFERMKRYVSGKVLSIDPLKINSLTFEA